MMTQDRFRVRVWFPDYGMDYLEKGNLVMFNGWVFIKALDKLQAVIEDHELMQCTGLKDEGNVLIWESDIVRRMWDKSVSVVRWSEGMWSCPSFHTNDTVLVIGNVHENPELVK